MRVAYVITRSDVIGGAHVHLRDLASALVEQGHEVKVFVGGTGAFTGELDSMGIPFCVVPHLLRPIRPERDVLAFLELRRMLTEFGPDLVAVHSSKAGWLGRLAGFSLRLPTVFTVHGWAFTDGVSRFSQMAFTLAERIATPCSTRIITVSAYDRELALRRCVASPGKMVVIHNGIRDVPQSLRAMPGQKPPLIIMVARFEEPKDHSSLILALSRLCDVPWQLLLVGDGPLRPAAEQLADDLGLAGRVRFLGTRRDVAELLAQAHIFALVSNWEGFPLSILEAMRAGLPVVASAVGGVKEAVVDGETGFLVPRGDTAALTQRLGSLLSNPELRLRHGQAGRARYETNFAFEQMLEKTLAVYRECLEETAERLRGYCKGHPSHIIQESIPRLYSGKK